MDKKKSSHISPIKEAKYLGDFVLEAVHFENLESLLKTFKTKEYDKLNHKQKSERVNRSLLELIQQAPEGFWLIAVIEYIDQINQHKILLNYSFSSFEIWLNQFSGLNEAENYEIRGKIAGKLVPRDEYQIFFPIGMGKTHLGSHFVTAHSSPDLDTTIASFWGWLDAFAARVSEGIHIWNVPGGAPVANIEVTLLFHHLFGQNVFQHLARTKTHLTLSSLELMTQRGVIHQQTSQSSLSIDHERVQKAIILVDEKGYFLGDWRSFDVEGVRQVVMLLNNCLRWFENNLHGKIISLFAKKDLALTDLPQFRKEVLAIQIQESDPALDFTEKQQRYIDTFLKKVLKIDKGLSATFEEFAQGMKALSLYDFQDCIDRIELLNRSELFDQKGKLIEDRSKIFLSLEGIISVLDRAIQNFRLYTERLEVALSIKTEVFGYLPQVVSYRADVDEVRSKMGNYPYLTVTSADEEGRMLSLGVVRARDLQQTILGTVTLRDFCNREETKIPSYLEVISVIDHHKSTLQTSSTPVVYISDAQSTNVLVAELAFLINDTFSTNGMSKVAIEAQIKEMQQDLHNPSNQRILQKLFKHLHASLQQERTVYFVDPMREFIEYLHFLYAILDDTDLLTKVSKRDVKCVVELLNRLRSLMQQKEVEILSLDDLKEDSSFVQNAASRILKHPDMYSLYRKIYIAKEHLIEESLLLCSQGKESALFIDTKLQSGYARVGQTKMFANNFKSFTKFASQMQTLWVQLANDFFKDRREFDLHLQMISTIAGAEDLFSGDYGKYEHKDELWIWIPMTEQSIGHLMGFLNAFRLSPQILENASDLEIEFLGPAARELSKIFKESFLPLTHSMNEKHQHSLAILRYKAGSINSRKAMISPYLPQL